MARSRRRDQPVGQEIRSTGRCDHRRHRQFTCVAQTHVPHGNPHLIRDFACLPRNNKPRHAEIIVHNAHIRPRDPLGPPGADALQSRLFRCEPRCVMLSFPLWAVFAIGAFDIRKNAREELLAVRLDGPIDPRHVHDIHAMTNNAHRQSLLSIQSRHRAPALGAGIAFDTRAVVAASGIRAAAHSRHHVPALGTDVAFDAGAVGAATRVRTIKDAAFSEGTAKIPEFEHMRPRKRDGDHHKKKTNEPYAKNQRTQPVAPECSEQRGEQDSPANPSQRQTESHRSEIPQDSIEHPSIRRQAEVFEFRRLLDLRGCELIAEERQHHAMSIARSVALFLRLLALAREGFLGRVRSIQPRHRAPALWTGIARNPRAVVAALPTRAVVDTAFTEFSMHEKTKPFRIFSQYPNTRRRKKNG